MDIISPAQDFMFKRLFSAPENEAIFCDLLESFISFKGRKIKELTQKHNPKVIKIFHDEDDVLDVCASVERSNKRVSISEIAVQMCSFPKFKDPTARMIVMYANQEGADDPYVDLHRCVSLCFTDFLLYDDESLSRSGMMAYEDGVPFTTKMEVIFVELPKARKAELTDNTDKKLLWAKVLAARSEEELDKLQKAANDPAITQAVLIIKKLSEDSEMLLEAENREKSRNRAEDLAQFEENLRQSLMNRELVEYALKKAAADSGE